MFRFQILVPCSENWFHDVEFEVSASGPTVVYNPCDSIPNGIRYNWDCGMCLGAIDTALSNLDSIIEGDWSKVNCQEISRDLQVFALVDVPPWRIGVELRKRELSIAELLHWHRTFVAGLYYKKLSEAIEKIVYERLKDPSFEPESITASISSQLLTANFQKRRTSELAASLVPDDLLQSWLWQQIELLRQPPVSPKLIDRMVRIGKPAAQVIEWVVRSFSNPNSRQAAEQILAQIDAAIEPNRVR